MCVGSYLCVIPGAAAIIERAGQARHAAGIWGGVAVIISGVLGNLAHTFSYSGNKPKTTTSIVIHPDSRNKFYQVQHFLLILYLSILLIPPLSVL